MQIKFPALKGVYYETKGIAWERMGFCKLGWEPAERSLWSWGHGAPKLELVFSITGKTFHIPSGIVLPTPSGRNLLLSIESGLSNYSDVISLSTSF